MARRSSSAARGRPAKPGRAASARRALHDIEPIPAPPVPAPMVPAPTLEPERKPRVRPVFIVAGLAVIALAIWRRKDVMWAGGAVMDAAKQQIFKSVLSSNPRPHADVILKVSGEEGVDPFVIVALGARESQWGRALRADGTGDHTARRGNWTKEKGVKVIYTAQELPSGWAAPKDSSGNALPGPYAIPADEMGWGRGIMQIDFPRAYAEGHDHRNVYANVKLGAKIFKEKLREVTAPPSGSWTVSSALAAKLGVAPGTYPAKAIPREYANMAAIAAYNTGSVEVRRAYSAGGLPAIDKETTGDDYSSWVENNLTSLVRKFIAAGGGGTTAAA